MYFYLITLNLGIHYFGPSISLLALCYCVLHRTQHNYTIDNREAKTVFVKATRHEKCCFMVDLGCMAERTCLLLTIIFKWKSLPKRAKFPNVVVVLAHKRWWMDESGTLEWLEKVWNKKKGAYSINLQCQYGIHFGLI